jgi:hypothetical protein
VIQWTPDPSVSTVTLDLGNGPSGDVNIVQNIVSGIPNSGVQYPSAFAMLTIRRVTRGLFQPPLFREATTRSRFLGTMGIAFRLEKSF